MKESFAIKTHVLAAFLATAWCIEVALCRVGDSVILK